MQAGRRTDGQTDRRRQTGRQTDGWMDGWTDGYIDQTKDVDFNSPPQVAGCEALGQAPWPLWSLSSIPDDWYNYPKLSHHFKFVSSSYLLSLIYPDGLMDWCSMMFHVHMTAKGDAWFCMFMCFGSVLHLSLDLDIRNICGIRRHLWRSRIDTGRFHHSKGVPRRCIKGTHQEFISNLKRCSMCLATGKFW
jgi:hypothetical protein